MTRTAISARATPAQTGAINEDYKTTMVFENDYAAVLPPPGPVAPAAPHPLLTAEPVQGGCDVVCFHPRHDLSLPTLSVDDIVAIIQEWTRIYHHRGTQDGVKYVQIFEAGRSLIPSKHTVWSASILPTLPAKELSNLRDYAESSAATTNGPKGYQNKPCLLCEYVAYERTARERIVVENEHFVALVPWWAYWPFEILVLPYKRHIPSLSQFTPEETRAFAEMISHVTIRYDNLFSCSFAYAMGIHQRSLPPKRVEGALVEDEDDIAHFHVHFEPPLLRSATVRKFLAGYEVMAEPQRDLTAEQAAQRLRGCSSKLRMHDAMSESELVDGHVSITQCKRAIDALHAYATQLERKRAETELLPGKEQHIWLQITVKTMHPERKLTPFRIPLKHPLVDPRTSGVCLITKDPQREYKDLLERHNIKFISRVVGVGKLKGKFKAFEARRLLLKENGMFLADERVIPLLPRLLGSKWFHAKKQPIPVCLTRKDLKGELERAIESSYMHQNKGTCTSVKIALLSHTPKQIQVNLETALPVIVSRIKGGWDNIQSLHIKTSTSVSLPIWTCELGSEEGGRWDGLLAEAEQEAVNEERRKKKKRSSSPRGSNGSERTKLNNQRNDPNRVESKIVV
ncbi:ribosomal protein L1p/L10e family-domain-containing protein [Boletus reticuloceps]|uniref:Galactose-1-phosphate uridylyltransferase n=1 Tax=Boletus reticuloceps TaxID=495285 RepID=A0A8I2YW19_9AGAM|nr:ribosomal protein L1p/L10e family-domain-containing protein [Boletus reticuloceps]